MCGLVSGTHPLAVGLVGVAVGLHASCREMIALFPSTIYSVRSGIVKPGGVCAVAPR